ncbi:MAG: type II toxin-antitoxin system HicB family antitoxin [Acidimicrobiia bacterium]|nr:type II toxin-antitoxin system HicB family antitoxin [Acidimicrobiia bacterium]
MATKRKAPRRHRVEVVRSGRWWAITVPDLGGVFSQARRLDQVDAMAREAIALMLDIDEADVGELDIDVEPPARVVDLLEALKRSEVQAEEARKTLAETRRRAAEELRAEGLPLRDVGELLGVTHQRVSQILAS